MHWLKALVFSICGAVVACLSIGQALACSRPGSFLSARSVYPPGGTVGVPVNARLVVSYVWNDLPSGNNPARNLGLRAAGGNPEDVVIISSEPERFRWARRASHIVKPRSELKPNTTYEVFDDNKRVNCSPYGDPRCEEGSQVVFATFTTGSSSDRKPPSFEGLQSVEGGTSELCDQGACCGPYRYIKVKLNWNKATDDVSDHVRSTSTWAVFCFTPSSKRKKVWQAPKSAQEVALFLY